MKQEMIQNEEMEQYSSQNDPNAGILIYALQH